MTNFRASSSAPTTPKPGRAKFGRNSSLAATSVFSPFQKIPSHTDVFKNDSTKRDESFRTKSQILDEISTFFSSFLKISTEIEAPPSAESKDSVHKEKNSSGPSLTEPARNYFKTMNSTDVPIPRQSPEIFGNAVKCSDTTVFSSCDSKSCGFCGEENRTDNATRIRPPYPEMGDPTYVGCSLKRDTPGKSSSGSSHPPIVVELYDSGSEILTDSSHHKFLQENNRINNNISSSSKFRDRLASFSGLSRRPSFGKSKEDCGKSKTTDCKERCEPEAHKRKIEREVQHHTGQTPSLATSTGSVAATQDKSEKFSPPLKFAKFARFCLEKSSSFQHRKTSDPSSETKPLEKHGVDSLILPSLNSMSPALSDPCITSMKPVNNDSSSDYDDDEEEVVEECEDLDSSFSSDISDEPDSVTDTWNHVHSDGETEATTKKSWNRSSGKTSIDGNVRNQRRQLARSRSGESYFDVASLFWSRSTLNTSTHNSEELRHIDSDVTREVNVSYQCDEILPTSRNVQGNEKKITRDILDERKFKDGHFNLTVVGGDEDSSFQGLQCAPLSTEPHSPLSRCHSSPSPFHNMSAQLSSSSLHSSSHNHSALYVSCSPIASCSPIVSCSPFQNHGSHQHHTDGHDDDASSCLSPYPQHTQSVTDLCSTLTLNDFGDNEAQLASPQFLSPHLTTPQRKSSQLTSHQRNSLQCSTTHQTSSQKRASSQLESVQPTSTHHSSPPELPPKLVPLRSAAIHALGISPSPSPTPPPRRRHTTYEADVSDMSEGGNSPRNRPTSVPADDWSENCCSPAHSGGHEPNFKQQAGALLPSPPAGQQQESLLLLHQKKHQQARDVDQLLQEQRQARLERQKGEKISSYTESHQRCSQQTKLEKEPPHHRLYDTHERKQQLEQQQQIHQYQQSRDEKDPQYMLHEKKKSVDVKKDPKHAQEQLVQIGSGPQQIKIIPQEESFKKVLLDLQQPQQQETAHDPQAKQLQKSREQQLQLQQQKELQIQQRVQQIQKQLEQEQKQRVKEEKKQQLLREKQEQNREKQEQKQQRQQEKLQQQLEKKHQKELQKQHKLEEQQQKLHEKQQQKLEKQQQLKEEELIKKQLKQQHQQQHQRQSNSQSPQRLPKDPSTCPLSPHKKHSTSALPLNTQIKSLPQTNEGSEPLQRSRSPQPLGTREPLTPPRGRLRSPPLPHRASSKVLPPPMGVKTSFNKSNRNALKNLSRSTPTMTPSGSPKISSSAGVEGGTNYPLSIIDPHAGLNSGTLSGVSHPSISAVGLVITGNSGLGVQTPTGGPGGVTTPSSLAGSTSLPGSVATLPQQPHINKATKKLLRLFPALPQSEIVLNSYSCALVSDILLQGTLFITNNNIAFYSKIFGHVSKLVFSFSQVSDVVKERTAKIIPNAVGLHLADGRGYVFGSLLSRDATFKLLVRVWRRSRDMPESDSEPPSAPHLTGEDDSASGSGGSPLEDRQQQRAAHSTAAHPPALSHSSNSPKASRSSNSSSNTNITADNTGNIASSNPSGSSPTKSTKARKPARDEAGKSKQDWVDGAAGNHHHHHHHRKKHDDDEVDGNSSSNGSQSNGDSGVTSSSGGTVNNIASSFGGGGSNTNTIRRGTGLPKRPVVGGSSSGEDDDATEAMGDGTNTTALTGVKQSLLQLVAAPRPLVASVACAIMLALLFLSAATLMHRVHRLSAQILPAHQQEHQPEPFSEGLYEEVLVMQQRLHAAAAAEVEKTLHIQLRHLATVRQSLDALSLLFSKDPTASPTQSPPPSPLTPFGMPGHDDPRSSLDALTGATHFGQDNQHQHHEYHKYQQQDHHQHQQQQKNPS